MRVRNLSVLAILTLISLVYSVPLAAQTPRAAPSNDDFINRQAIAPGKNVSVTNIHEATIEANQPVPPACGTINFSVWYSFSVPQATDIHLSTGGSLLKTAFRDSIDTVIALYTGSDIFTLSLAGCNDDAGSPYAEIVFPAAAGTTYHVLVGAGDPTPLVAGSLLVLDTRVLETGFVVANHEFELPLTSADWTVTNSTGDDRVCSTPALPAMTGSCAFAFVGNAGEASGVKLTMPLPTYFVPRKNGSVLVQYFFRVLNAPLGTTKIKFKVKYSDGTPPSVATLNLTGEAPGSYTLARSTVLLASRAVNKLQIQASFKSTTGALMLDLFVIGYQAAGTTRDAAPLPAPLGAPGM